MYRVFFFFKQKTAYEMRISDWSSDVCSSDLALRRVGALSQHQQPDHVGWAETARMVLAGPEPAFGSSPVSARAFLPLSRAASPDRARHARPRNPNDRDRQPAGHPTRAMIASYGRPPHPKSVR